MPSAQASNSTCYKSGWVTPASPLQLLRALELGTPSDLRFALKFAETIVSATEALGDVETLNEGFRSFRARNDYVEDESDDGQIDVWPYADEDIAAPPADLTSLGRFNLEKRPALYLATAPEVALAECKALPSDTCTVGQFELSKPCKVAQFLRHGKLPINVFLGEGKEEDFERWLLADTADFLSRRVSAKNRETHYRACNFIASAFKEHGYDGLVYRTSFWSSAWRTGKNAQEQDQVRSANIVLFDVEAATPTKSWLAEINWKRPIAEQAGKAVWTKQQ